MFLGVLQLVMIRPYYRDNRLMMISNLASTIESNLLNKKANQSDIDNIFALIVNNDTCVAIYAEDGKNIYNSDALGEACMINKELTVNNMNINIAENPSSIIEFLKANKSIDSTIVSDITGLEMLMYAKEIKSNLVNYYLVINSPLEPVESVVDFILNQYIYIAIIVFVVALVFSIYFANKLSSPIVRMKKEANRLGSGHYDVEFKSNNDYFTETRDLANTLDNAAIELSKIDELRKDLIANMSHDIKTPLTMIQAYAEMIEDISGDDPIKRKEHLDVILKETEYLNKLVTDMQELSKMQAGYIELKRNNFDLKNATEDILDLLHELFVENEINLVLSLKEVTIYGDEIKISQVIYNYVSNAIKHSKKGQNIYINIIDDEEKVIFEVIDEGDGIAEEDLPYIWDRYYKIDKGFKRNLESTGLGLAIVKVILDAHHFKYGVESSLNKGAKFYFELSKEYEEENEGLS